MCVSDVMTDMTKKNASTSRIGTHASCRLQRTRFYNRNNMSVWRSVSWKTPIPMWKTRRLFDEHQIHISLHYRFGFSHFAATFKRYHKTHSRAVWILPSLTRRRRRFKQEKRESLDQKRTLSWVAACQRRPADRQWKKKTPQTAFATRIRSIFVRHGAHHVIHFKSDLISIFRVCCQSPFLLLPIWLRPFFLHINLVFSVCDGGF